MAARSSKKIAASLLSIDELVDRYVEMASLVRPSSIERIAPDPDDDVVIATAVAAQADFIVTGDRSLLSVGRYHDCRIVGVNEAVRTVYGS